MDILFKEEITLVTLQNAPANLTFLSQILDAVAALQINIDMISQEPPQGNHSSLSFTISDEDLVKILVMTSALREQYPSMKPVVSSGNCKITAFDEGMRTKSGVAAHFFAALSSQNPDIPIITTSEVEISVLVTKAHAEQTLDAVRKAFS